MALPNSLKIVEVCTIAPHSGSLESASPSSLPLTFFDIRWLRFAPVQRLYFYELSSSNAPVFFDSVLPKLKTSLSLVLLHFLPLAGNLTWPQDSQKPILSYAKGDSVSLTIAKSEAGFCHLSSNSFVEAEEYHPLVPRLEVSHERAAVIALQITIFPNSGFSIGTSMHHSILDGKSSTSFVKSWAHICKNLVEGEGGLLSSSNLLPDQLKQFYDRRVIEDPADFGAIYSSQYLNMGHPNNRSLMIWETKTPPDSIRGTFEFTRANIETLRQSLMAKLAETKQHDIHSVHVSTFSLVCAYTWICLVKAEEIKDDKTRLGFNMDCRSRLNPPIPSNYFGNCVSGRVVVADTKSLLGEDGLAVAVNAISEGIKSSEKGILDGAENWISRLLVVTTERMLTVAGSHRFGVYDTDFGWGRPKKVEMVSIDRTRAISFSDPKNGAAGGLEIGLVLEKHHMEVFASLFYKGLETF